MTLTTETFEGFKCRETKASQKSATNAGNPASSTQPNKRVQTGPNLYAVIKGIPLDFTDVELSEILELPAKRLRSAAHDVPTTLVKITCDSLEQKTNFLKNRIAFNFRKHVVVDYKIDGPQQCYKCQAFGHQANNCTNEQHCKTCGAEHKHTECPNVDNKKCSNCNGEHPSTFKGCPAYIVAKTQKHTETITYAHATAKPPGSIESIRLAAAIAEALTAALVGTLNRETAHQMAAKAVSIAYRTLVSPSETMAISSVKR